MRTPAIFQAFKTSLSRPPSAPQSEKPFQPPRPFLLPFRFSSPMRRHARRLAAFLLRGGSGTGALPGRTGGVVSSSLARPGASSARAAAASAHPLSSLATSSHCWTTFAAASSSSLLAHNSTRRHVRVSSSVLAATEVRVASMGESISEGSVAAILAPPGTAVEEDAVIAQIETDKVTIDVRAPSAGVVQQILVKEGESVVVGQLVAILGDEGK